VSVRSLLTRVQRLEQGRRPSIYAAVWTEAADEFQAQIDAGHAGPDFVCQLASPVGPRWGSSSLDAPERAGVRRVRKPPTAPPYDGLLGPSWSGAACVTPITGCFSWEEWRARNDSAFAVSER
jgi:hypothetical protein